MTDRNLQKAGHRLIASAVASLLLALPLRAADDEGRFAVDGIGNQTCATFVEALEAGGDDARFFSGWTQGFFTAVNVFREDTFDITAFQPIELTLLQLRQFCASNPEMRYVNALGRLVSVYASSRLTQADEIVRFAVDDRAVFIYRSVLDRTRDALIAKGIAPEGIDDSALPGFLGDFQKRNALAVTGLPDTATLNLLFP